MYTRFLYPSPVANGDSWFQVGLLYAVGVNAFVEESFNALGETVFSSNEVFAIAVNGAVGGVKAEE